MEDIFFSFASFTVRAYGSFTASICPLTIREQESKTKPYPMKQAGNFWVPDGDSYFTRILSVYDTFESGRLNAALKYVKNFRVALDIGGHIGLRTIDLAPRFSSVYTFEPQLENYACLLANVTSIFGNVTLFNVALGDTEGEVAMMESSTRPGNSGSYFVTEGTGTRLTTLDSYGFSGVDFIKMDCENYEFFVLRGGEQTIKKNKPVILMEQKHFKDAEGRIPVDYRAAGQLLESWGASCIEIIKNDRVYLWDTICL